MRSAVAHKSGTRPPRLKMSTLICFALKEEAAPFRTGLRRGHHVSILVTGIGRQNAEKSLREFLNSCRSRGNETQIKKESETPYVVSYEPDLVLTCGFAGGLNPDLKLGDVVFEVSSSSSRRESPQIEIGEKSEPIDIGCHDKLIAGGARPAIFFSADRIATTVAEKKRLREQTGADAVEMESAAIHAVCAERKIPCVTVRVISDTANEDLPLDFNALTKADKNLDFGKLFLAIAKSPGKIPALMELQKKTKFAAEKLAAVLAKIIFP
jgi:adenosylhomocysteine nucleosidase